MYYDDIERSFSFVFCGAELLYKGVDISKFTRQEFTQKIKEFTEDFSIDVDEDTMKFFKLPTKNCVREDDCVYCLQKVKKGYKGTLNLSLDKAKDIMQVLRTADIEHFLTIDGSLYIPEYAEQLRKLDEGYDYAKALDCDIKNLLTREKTDMNLRIFLALFNYKNNYSHKLYEDSKKDKTFHLKSFKDFEVVDNRMIIPLKPSDILRIKKKLLQKGYKESELSFEINDLKGLVISKNIYDYFWASYGNAYQSCFALNSNYNYLYGYVPFAMADESFIIYATTGKVNRIPIISGRQFLCPNMIFRAWGYASKDGDLLVDKRYKQSNNIYNDFVDIFLDFMRDRFDVVAPKVADSRDVELYNDGKGIYNIFNVLHTQFYSDSLVLDSENERTTFRFAYGTHGTGSNRVPWNHDISFLSYASTVREISEGLTLDKPTEVVNGVLMNPNICPITGLKIPLEIKESPYARYLTVPSEHTAVISYINGRVFLDECTEESSTSDLEIKNDEGLTGGFLGGRLFVLPYQNKISKDSKSLTLKSVKEFIKGHIKDTCYDTILLRIVEPTEIKFQQFRNK